MKTYFVSRHAGTVEWAKLNGIECEVVSHFNVEMLPCNVIGTLPIHLVAEVCENGGSYHNCQIEIPADRRGTELSCQDLIDFGCVLVEYTAERRKNEN